MTSEEHKKVLFILSKARDPRTIRAYFFLMRNLYIIIKRMFVGKQMQGKITPFHPYLFLQTAVPGPFSAKWD